MKEWKKVGVNLKQINQILKSRILTFRTLEENTLLVDITRIFPETSSSLISQQSYEIIYTSPSLENKLKILIAACLFTKTINRDIVLSNLSIQNQNRYLSLPVKIFQAYILDKEILKILCLSNSAKSKKFVTYEVNGQPVKEFRNLTRNKFNRMLIQMDREDKKNNFSEIWVFQKIGDNFEVFLRRDHRRAQGQTKKSTFTYISALSAIVRLNSQGTNVQIYAESEGLNNILKQHIENKWLVRKGQFLKEPDIVPVLEEKIVDLINKAISVEYDAFNATEIETSYNENNIDNGKIIIKGEPNLLRRMVSDFQSIGFDPINPKLIKRIKLDIPNFKNINIYISKVGELSSE